MVSSQKVTTLFLLASLAPVVLSVSCDYEDVDLESSHDKSSILSRVRQNDEATDVEGTSGLGSCEDMRWDLKKMSLKATRFAESFVESANARGFVVVAPAGVSNSFNAGPCCGRAQRDKLDDVGYLCAVKRHLVKRVLTMTTESDVDAFAVGWSNGGYMVTLAAATMPGLFRAIAPISGYQYDLNAISPFGRSVSDRRDGTFAVPMFMQHSRDDPMVRFEGCCDRQETHCCCGISKHGPRDGTCLDAEAGFRNWARDINGCGGDGVKVTTEPVEKMGDVELGEEGAGGVVLATGDVGVKCVEAKECVGRTVFCAHEGAGHFGNFARDFPLNMKLAIFEFFQQHASDGDA